MSKPEPILRPVDTPHADTEARAWWSVHPPEAPDALAGLVAVRGNHLLGDAWFAFPGGRLTTIDDERHVTTYGSPMRPARSRARAADVVVDAWRSRRRGREFVTFSRAGYHPSVTLPPGVVEEVLLSGDGGEFAIRWHAIGRHNAAPSPRLEMFCDSWRALRDWPDVLAALAELATAEGHPALPLEVERALLALGFVDATPRRDGAPPRIRHLASPIHGRVACGEASDRVDVVRDVPAGSVVTDVCGACVVALSAARR